MIILIIRIVDLFTFSHGSNRNKQGGCVTLMWLGPFQVSFQYFDVAAGTLKNSS